jgi:hypothetical protein
VHLLEEEAKEDQHGTKRLPNGEDVAEDQHGAEDGEELSCGGENRTIRSRGRTTSYGNGQKTRVLLSTVIASLDRSSQSSRVEVSWE